MRAFRLESIQNLHVAELNVLVILIDRLGTESKRLDYAELAEELGYSRNTIKYNIDKLAEAGLISKAGGKLTVVQDIFVEMPTG